MLLIRKKPQLWHECEYFQMEYWHNLSKIFFSNISISYKKISGFDLYYNKRIQFKNNLYSRRLKKKLFFYVHKQYYVISFPGPTSMWLYRWLRAMFSVSVCYLQITALQVESPAVQGEDYCLISEETSGGRTCALS